jgi:hypothetical protein
MPTSIGENKAKRKPAEGELVLCMGVGGVRDDFEFQTWLIQLGMRYLTAARMSAISLVLAAPT